MRKLMTRIYTGTIFNLIIVSTVLADNCSSPGDCLQTAGYNAMVAIVGGILGIVSGVYGFSLADKILAPLYPSDLLEELGKKAHAAGSYSVFQNEVEHSAKLGRITHEQAEELLTQAKSNLRYPDFGDESRTSGFGDRIDPITNNRIQNHKGVDLAAPFETPVQAVAPGVVVRSEYSESYGNIVILDNGTDSEGNTYYTVYAHNAGRLVDVGDSVEEDQHISDVSATGHATGTHLHYELRVVPPSGPKFDQDGFYEKNAVNPYDYRWPNLTQKN